MCCLIKKKIIQKTIRMGNVILGKEQICKLLFHGDNIIYIDKIVDYVPGKSIKAVKFISDNDSFLEGHFKDNPIVPGMIIIEALGQTGAILNELDNIGWNKVEFIDVSGGKCDKIGVLGEVKVNFIKPVFPKQNLVLEVKLDWAYGSAVKFIVKATVDNNICVKGTIIVCNIEDEKKAVFLNK